MLEGQTGANLGVWGADTGSKFSSTFTRRWYRWITITITVSTEIVSNIHHPQAAFVQKKGDWHTPNIGYVFYGDIVDLTATSNDILSNKRQLRGNQFMPGKQVGWVLWDIGFISLESILQKSWYLDGIIVCWCLFQLTISIWLIWYYWSN